MFSQTLISYIIRQRALRKVFLSIKGIYYQAEVMGEKLTWIIPYKFAQEVPRFVDIGVMLNFLEFHETLMGFVNYKLFNSLGLHYPPQFDVAKADEGEGLFAVILSPLEKESTETGKTMIKASKAAKDLPSNLSIKGVEEEDEEEDDEDEDEEGIEEAEVFQTETPAEDKEMEAFKNLFSKCAFFLSREVPKDSLEFVIRSFGGQVSWDGDLSPYGSQDPRITHFIIDRDIKPTSEFTRAFVQPQWVYDCINSQILLPVEEYGITSKLPPHLSPFVNNEAEGYVPQRAKEINRMVANARGEVFHGSDDDDSEEEESDDEDAQEVRFQKELEAEQKGISFSDARADVMEDEDSEAEEKPKKKSKKERALEEEEQQKQLAKSLIPSRRRRRLYDNIKRSQKRKEDRNNVLLEKSRLLESRRAKPE